MLTRHLRGGGYFIPMSLQGPIIVVAEALAPPLAEALAAAGAFPVVEAGREEIAGAVASVEPAAIILAGSAGRSALKLGGDLARAVDASARSYVPVIAWISGDQRSPFDWALPVDADEPHARLIARLRAALRVRTLHAAVLRRIASATEHGNVIPEMPQSDPLGDATVLLTGRGRSYPALSVVIGERVSVIGALSLEAATRVLKARDIDAVVIGDGFNKRMVETFLSDLANDPRFRDLPVAVLDDVGADIDPERLPNLDRICGDPLRVSERILPLARIHALAGRLRRMAASLDQRGLTDPSTGLRTRAAFFDDLKRVIAEASDRGDPLSVARLSLANLTENRASLDAARIVARLVRTTDFACRDPDGTILVAFTQTDLGIAHLVARRIVSVLKHTMLSCGRDRAALEPCIAIAALKSRDTVDTLIARIACDGMVAAS
jgi:GGDEF domain-containing protein